MLAFGAVIAIIVPAAAGVTKRAFKDTHGTRAFWHQATARPAALRAGVKPVLKLRTKHVRSFTLSRASLHQALGAAPRERTRAARLHPLVVTLPAPNGTFQRFALQQSAIMSPGLARRHPEIKTYSGRGIDDRAATIHADLSPIGFHASVRSSKGAWYIDPYYHNSQSRYVSYYGRDLANTDGPFVERDAAGGEVSVDEGYYHAADTVTVRGSEFAHNATVSITISDPEDHFADEPCRPPPTSSARSERASSPIRTGTWRRTSSRRPTGARRPRRATRSCATMIRPSIPRPATCCGTTGSR